MNSDQFKFAVAGLVLIGCVGGWLTLRARRKAKKEQEAFWRKLEDILTREGDPRI